MSLKNAMSLKNVESLKNMDVHCGLRAVVFNGKWLVFESDSSTPITKEATEELHRNAMRHR